MLDRFKQYNITSDRLSALLDRSLDKRTGLTGRLFKRNLQVVCTRFADDSGCFPLTGASYRKMLVIRRVFIKNLDRKVGNKDLNDAFSIFGNILSCKVAQDEYGRSKGFGFVHFEREEDAKEAIDRANNTMIGDKTVFVGKFQKREERGDSANDYQGNLYVKHFPQVTLIAFQLLF